ncbi:mariner Mos1 transposase [Trichonephila clavipes]|nr:mariner Mos1 transposase [Trichonephila clavipes]
MANGPRRLNRAVKKNAPITTPDTIKLFCCMVMLFTYCDANENLLGNLNWEILTHPPCSPAIAPFDYHLLRSRAHDLSKQHFTSHEVTKTCVSSWIVPNDETFFRLGIRILLENGENKRLAMTNALCKT